MKFQLMLIGILEKVEMLVLVEKIERIGTLLLNLEHGGEALKRLKIIQWFKKIIRDTVIGVADVIVYIPCVYHIKVRCNMKNNRVMSKGSSAGMVASDFFFEIHSKEIVTHVRGSITWY